MPKKTVAIVGAGVAGLACAVELGKSGIVADVFDLGSRGPGGRASTRPAHVEGLDEPLAFDHGAIFFTAETPGFKVRERTVSVLNGSLARGRVCVCVCVCVFTGSRIHSCFEPQALCEELREAGYIARWEGRFATLHAATNEVTEKKGGGGQAASDVDFFGILRAEDVWVGNPMMKSLGDGLVRLAGLSPLVASAQQVAPLFPFLRERRQSVPQTLIS